MLTLRQKAVEQVVNLLHLDFAGLQLFRKPCRFGRRQVWAHVRRIESKGDFQVFVAKDGLLVTNDWISPGRLEFVEATNLGLAFFSLDEQSDFHGIIGLDCPLIKVRHGAVSQEAAIDGEDCVVVGMSDRSSSFDSCTVC